MNKGNISNKEYNNDISISIYRPRESINKNINIRQFDIPLSSIQNATYLNIPTPTESKMCNDCFYDNPIHHPQTYKTYQNKEYHYPNINIWNDLRGLTYYNPFDCINMKKQKIENIKNMNKQLVNGKFSGDFKKCQSLCDKKQEIKLVPTPLLFNNNSRLHKFNMPF